MALYLILGLGLILRLLSLNQSLWLDEAILANAVSRLSLTDLITQYMPTDFNPPLFYLFEWFWGRWFGFSEIALRFPSVIFGLLTVYLVYRLGGKLPALLLATSGLSIYYSQEARMYSLAALAVVASFYFLKEKKWRWYALAILAAVYSHYLTILVLPAQWLITKKQQRKKVVMFQLLAALGFLPWLPVFIHQLNSGFQATATTWGSIGALTIKAAALIPVKFLIGRISFEPPLVYALITALGLGVWLWLMVISRRQAKDFALWLGVPLVLGLILSVKLSILSYFRFLFLLPAVYLWLDLGVNKLKKHLRLPVMVFLVVFNLATAAIYLFNPQFHREDWRGLTQFLVLANPEQNPVFIYPQVAAPLTYYYAGTINQDGADEIWLIPYAQPIFDPQNLTAAKLKVDGYLPVFSKTFGGDLSLIKYRRL